MKSKPSNLKYTDLCIYIDKTIYNRDENNNPISLREMSYVEQEKVYDYLCNLIGALTYKNKYFLNAKDREEFITDFATELFLRLTNKSQNFLMAPNEKSNKKNLRPIKSILNYIKGCLNFSIMDYRNAHYKEIIDPQYNDMEEFNGCREYLENYVRSDYQRDYQELLEEQIKNIPFFLKTILDNSMFKHNVIERHNLELSILLTLHSMVSLPNKINKQDIAKQRVQLNSQLNNWKNNVVLWKVTESVTKELVILYIQKLFSKIYSEVSKTEDEEYLPEDIVKEILNSAWPTYGLNNATMED